MDKSIERFKKGAK